MHFILFSLIALSTASLSWASHEVEYEVTFVTWKRRCIHFLDEWREHEYKHMKSAMSFLDKTYKETLSRHKEFLDEDSVAKMIKLEDAKDKALNPKLSQVERGSISQDLDLAKIFSDPKVTSIVNTIYSDPDLFASWSIVRKYHALKGNPNNPEQSYQNKEKCINFFSSLLKQDDKESAKKYEEILKAFTREVALQIAGRLAARRTSKAEAGFVPSQEDKFNSLYKDPYNRYYNNMVRQATNRTFDSFLKLFGESIMVSRPEDQRIWASFIIKFMKPLSLYLMNDNVPFYSEVVAEEMGEENFRKVDALFKFPENTFELLLKKGEEESLSKSPSKEEVYSFLENIDQKKQGFCSILRLLEGNPETSRVPDLQPLFSDIPESFLHTSTEPKLLWCPKEKMAFIGLQSQTQIKKTLKKNYEQEEEKNLPSVPVCFGERFDKIFKKQPKSTQEEMRLMVEAFSRWAQKGFHPQKFLESLDGSNWDFEALKKGSKICSEWGVWAIKSREAGDMPWFKRVYVDFKDGKAMAVNYGHI